MSTSCDWEGKCRYSSFRLRMKRRVCTVQVKLCYSLTMRAIHQRLKDVSCGGVIQIYDLYLLYLQKQWIVFCFAPI